MAEPREFICQDCGTPVVIFAQMHANDVDVCLTCLWLRAIEDPVEREQLRKFLQGDRDGT